MEKFSKNKIDEVSYKKGSHSEQVVELTKRISYLTEHLKSFKKDNIAKRSLFKLVSKKKKFLRYLLKKDPEAYTSLTNLTKKV